MNKLTWIGAFAVLACVMPAFAEDEQADFETLARRYRISVYDTYHQDRATYDRLQQLGQMAVWLYSKSDDDVARQDELTRWVEEARSATLEGGEDVKLPPLPGQENYETLDEFATAIEFDANAVRWLQHQPDPALAQLQKFPRRTTESFASRATTQFSSTTPSRAGNDQTSTSGSSSDEKRSVLSRVLGAVTGSDSDGDVGSDTDSSDMPTFEQDVVDADALSLQVFGEPNDPVADHFDTRPEAGARDEESSESAINWESGSGAGADTDNGDDQEMAEHREVLLMLQRLLENGTANVDRKMLNLQATLMENWFPRHAQFEAQYTTGARQGEMAKMRGEAVAAVTQLRDRATELLIEAQGAKDPSAAHRSELKQLKSLQKRLEKLLSDTP